MDIGEEVKREKVEAVLREIMDGEKGIWLRLKREGGGVASRGGRSFGATVGFVVR